MSECPPRFSDINQPTAFSAQEKRKALDIAINPRKAGEPAELRSFARRRRLPGFVTDFRIAAIADTNRARQLDWRELPLGKGYSLEFYGAGNFARPGLYLGDRTLLYLENKAL